MELIRSYYWNNSRQGVSGPFTPNYLEYYYRFADISPIDHGDCIDSMISKFCLSFGIKRKISTCLKKSLKWSNSNYPPFTFHESEKMLRTLFGNTGRVLTFKQDEPEVNEMTEPVIIGKDELNQISIWSDLKFWSFYLRNITCKEVALQDYSFCSKFNLTSFLIFPFVNEGSKEKLKNEITKSDFPNWVQLTYEYYNPHGYRNNFSKAAIDDRYFARLAFIYRSRNVENMTRSILSTVVPVYSNWNCLSPITPIENIDLFEEIDTNRKSVKYDLTGIQYPIHNPFRFIDLELSLPDIYNISNLTIEQKKFLNKCVNLYNEKAHNNMRVLLENNKEAQDKYKQSFPLLQDIFKLICLSTQKVINSKKHLPYINSGHRVGIFRSLYSPDWYMISSQYIAPINDLKEFLLALQYESVDGFMFTRKDTFDDGVNKWKDILKEFRRYAVIKWTPGS